MEREYDPLTHMANRMQAWLADPNESFEPLTDWLGGYDLSGAFDQNDTFLAIVEALKLCREPDKAKEHLAGKIQQFLVTRPDLDPGSNPKGLNPSQVRMMRNLFLLCANLAVPEKFKAPLERIAVVYLRGGGEQPTLTDDLVVDSLNCALQRNGLEITLQLPSAPSFT